MTGRDRLQMWLPRRDSMARLGAPLVAAVGAATHPAASRAELADGVASLEPLRIAAVEAFVIRTPPDRIAFDAPFELPPIGYLTEGRGLSRRLDHASPSRFKGYEQATLVRITTDSGLVGWGECHAPAAPRMHQMIVTDLLAPILRGQDARAILPLWERMYTSERVRGYSTGAHLEAIAGADLALWDLLGKALRVPVYRLLGGKCRDGIPLYVGVGGATPDELAERARQALARGIRMVKMSLRKGAGTEDFSRVAAVSEAMGTEGQVSVDSLGGFRLFEAIRVGRELDRLGNVGFFEDALLLDDMAAYPALAGAISTPVCTGEPFSNRFQFRDLLEQRGADLINPDVCRAGGVTECLRIAQLADTYGVPWTPHVSTGTALYFAASLHLAVATPGCFIMEGGNKLDAAFGNRLLREPLPVRDGIAYVTDRPGFGVEFDPDALQAVTVG